MATRAYIYARAHVHERVGAYPRARARDGTARIVLVRACISCVGAARGEDGVMEGNGTEKGSGAETGDRASPATSPPPPATRHSFIFYFQKS